MPLPKAREALPFYRSARHRYQDAQFLLDADRTTGAIYLAGYSVECILKALILSSASAKARNEVLATFRGGQAHNYDWLRAEYLRLSGRVLPAAINKQFLLVNSWTTDLRYESKIVKRREVEAFLRATDAIIIWADGRF